MHKHDILKHNGQVQQYTARYVTEERGILPLAMREGILIESQIHGTSLNDRKEKGRATGLVRIQAGVT